MEYEVIQIDEKSWRIEENGVRSFLFVGTEKALLVDSGFGSGDLKSVVEELAGGLPIMLVNTHADGDHIGCNSQFGVAYMHPAEFAKLATTECASPAVPLWEGDTIAIGGRSFAVILIPGHTPGSIALFDIANRIMIAGDSVQAGAIFMFGEHRSVPAYIASLKKLEAWITQFDVVYPSHGPFPVKSDIIPGLIAGAEKLLAGELEAEEPPFPVPAKLYKCDVASFLYSK